MIAIITEDLKIFKDWIVWATVGCLLEQRPQRIVCYDEVNFAELASGEILYFIQHGWPGSGGGAWAVTVDKGTANESRGFTSIIGKAIQNAPKKCPKKIVMELCFSGKDFKGGNPRSKADMKKTPMEGAASLVRGVSMALAKHNVQDTTVTGYLGSAIVKMENPDLGKTYVVTDAGDKAAGDCQKKLMEKYELAEPFENLLLKESDFAKRAKLAFKHDAVQGFFRDLIAACVKEKWVYPDGKGVVNETWKDGLQNLPGKK
jgi:hypothetical protein